MYVDISLNEITTKSISYGTLNNLWSNTYWGLRQGLDIPTFK